MFRQRRVAYGGSVFIVAALALSAPASAHDKSGGTVAAPSPVVTSATCVSTARATCVDGDYLHLEGENLNATTRVTFLGRTGRGDDRRAKPRTRSSHLLTVRVPRGARTGLVRLSGRRANSASTTVPIEVTSARSMQTPQPTTSVATAFPVTGAHGFGTATNRFGGGRGHQGQDVFSDCGTPIVAAVAGSVTTAEFQDRAGNYAVIKTQDGSSHVYMHMQAPATVVEGQEVVAGQPIGAVGQTGRATGCHLHFEIWTAPGWYEGGSPIDPLPQLQAWEAAAAR